MAAPLIKDVSKRLLRDIGVTSLSGNIPAGQIIEIENGDRDDIAMIMTAAMQEMYDDGPSEMSQRPGSCYLHAPTNVTLNVTVGSNAITSVTTYASWMEGCTIRISGDEQDNEIINSTTLGRPYTGGTANGVSAVVYADSYTFDDTIQHIMEPVFSSNPQNFWPIQMASSAEDFSRMGGWPMVGTPSGFAMGSLWLFSKKTASGRILAWMSDGYYDPALNYLKRRMRFTPMPDRAMSIGFTALHNPPRIIGSQISDSNTDVLPVPNTWVESIYIPICRQIMTGHGLFKSNDSKPEIARAYKAAKARLKNTRGAIADTFAKYPK